jgi:hypothetical protein
LSDVPPAISTAPEESGSAPTQIYQPSESPIAEAPPREAPAEISPSLETPVPAIVTVAPVVAPIDLPPPQNAPTTFTPRIVTVSISGTRRPSQIQIQLARSVLSSILQVPRNHVQIIVSQSKKRNSIASFSLEVTIQSFQKAAQEADMQRRVRDIVCKSMGDRRCF